MRLQKLTIAALDAVYAIEQQVHTHPWSKAALAEAFTHNILIGLYVHEQLQGFAIILNAIEVVELLDIAVVPSRQRQGLGKLLLQEVITTARQLGCSRIMLEVRQSNHGAQVFYRRNGFVEIYRRKGYYATDTGREEALIMEYTV